MCLEFVFFGCFYGDRYVEMLLAETVKETQLQVFTQNEIEVVLDLKMLMISRTGKK